MSVSGSWRSRTATGFAALGFAALGICATDAAAETTATAGMKKVRDLVVYRDRQFYSAFPSIVARPDGELVCSFRRAPSRRYLWGAGGDRHTDANSYLVSVRSQDGGETWTSPPQLLYAHAFGGSQDPCLLQMRDGGLLCASYGWALMPPEALKAIPNLFHGGGFGFLGGYLLTSGNGGASWEGPIYPPSVPGNVSVSALNGPLPAYNRGALLERKDGALLWAVARHDALAPARTSVHLMRSSDQGRDWEYEGPIAADPKIAFNETSLVETPDGVTVAFLRTENNGGKAAMALSRDGGKSFEPWQDLGWVGYPLQATRLSGGGILLVYGYRTAPFGVRARLVADDLSDVRTAPEIVLRDDGGTTDLGYPWAVERPDGSVLVVYYINVADGPRHIAATVLQRE